MSKAAELARFIGDGTLGLGGAEDKKLVFDGNAQDFHIGLDDSTDSLTIGLGSTLGTTSHMVFDANGHITKPLQPAFQAVPSSDINNLNVSGASNTTLVFDTERFDANGDYNNGSGIFTAPVTGKYQLQYVIRLQNTDTDVTSYDFEMVTSNKAYKVRFDPDYGDSDTAFLTVSLSILADMDAADTAKLQYYQFGGSAQTDVDTESYFSGYLVA